MRRSSEGSIGNPARFVVAAGGYRTGSTLQYNLCGAYVEGIGVGRRLGLVEPDDVDAMLAEHGGREGFVGVAKCHHAVAGFRPFTSPTRWADLVVEGRARAITSHRDRDAQRRSMMRKFHLTEDTLDESVVWREDIANERRWSELATVRQSYEMLTRLPGAALHQLCTALDLPWDLEAALTAIESSGVAAVLAGTSGSPEGHIDPLTLVHWDHISPETAATLATDSSDR